MSSSANNAPIAVVTGITGQDGAYLSELLLSKGYTVFGTYRRTSSVNFWRIEELGIHDHPALHLVEYDLTDLSSSIRLLQTSGATEVYNLAAQSFVGVSFEQPLTTAEITGIGPVNLLEAIRIVNPRIRFYQASTSEMFGKVQAIPQVESTPFYPRSPYGVAKLYAHWMTINYRESYDIFATSGILFNHESPLRGREFVTRKITDSVAKIVQGKLDVLELGNMDVWREFNDVRDVVHAYRKLIEAAPVGQTVNVCSSNLVSLRDALALASEMTGHSLNVSINSAFVRPNEVLKLGGDTTLLKTFVPDWKPRALRETLGWMIDAESKNSQRS